MYNQRIKPEKITTPTQLLAAWLVALVILVGIFVYASIKTDESFFICLLYAGASILIIPLFLIIIFMLQTKYRPEMQEDKYYAPHLAKRYEYLQSLKSTKTIYKRKK